MVCTKLVRDRIAEELMGKPNVVVRQVRGEELEYMLRLKLVEEAIEFALSGAIEELCDILEVIHAILNTRGISIEEVERLRLTKRTSRGGFDKGYVVTWLDRDLC